MQEELVKLLRSNLDPVSKEQFNSWKRDPVTQHLFRDFAAVSILGSIDDSPTDYHDAVKNSFLMEGFVKAVCEIFDWMPDNVRQEKEGDNNE